MLPAPPETRVADVTTEPESGDIGDEDPHAADLENQLADCRRQGARYLVIAALEPAPAAPIGVAGRAVARGDGFAIFDLKAPE